MKLSIKLNFLIHKQSMTIRLMQAAGPCWNLIKNPYTTDQSLRTRKGTGMRPVPFLLHIILCKNYANAFPSETQSASACASGASLQITLLHANCAPVLMQSSSQVRIHSPSPQP